MWLLRLPLPRPPFGPGASAVAALGDQVDAQVDQDHDKAGCKERSNAGGQNVPGLLVELARVGKYFSILSIAENINIVKE